MRKKTSKRIISIALALIVASAIAFVPQLSEVHAGYDKMIKYKKNLTVSTVDSGFFLMVPTIKNYKNNLKAPSSKRYVAVAEVFDPGMVWVSVKKTGKTKIKIPKSKGKTRVCNLKVVKYQNAFKSFKVGKVSVAGQYKKNNWGYFNNKLTKSQKQKITIVPKKNWRVKTITLEPSKEIEKYDKNGDLLDSYYKRGKVQKVKNNSKKSKKFTATVTIMDKTWENRVEVEMYNKKTKLTETYFLLF